MRTSLLTAGLVVLAVGGAAAAGIAHAVGDPSGAEHAHGGPGAMPDFSTLDADGDGTITKQEFVDATLARMRDRLERRFDRIDADADGSVTVADLTAARAAAMERFRQHSADCARDGGAAPADAAPATPDAGP